MRHRPPNDGGCTRESRVPIRTTPRRLLGEDLKASGNRIGSATFHALVMYRFGVWRASLPAGLARKLLRLPYTWAHWHVRHRRKIELHFTATLGRRITLSEAGHITIGNGASIGDDCFVGPGVTLGRLESGWPTIGSGVVLSPGAVVLGAVHVGDDAVIGPNAVVLNDVPPGATVSLRSLDSGRGLATPAPKGTTDVSLRPLRFHDVPANVQMGPGTMTSCSGYVAFYGPIRLGANCRIREGVTIGWPSHGDSTKQLTRIGSRVELGAGVVVMAGVCIDDDAQVEPNVIVNGDVPAGMRLRALAAKSFGQLGTIR